MIYNESTLLVIHIRDEELEDQKERKKEKKKKSIRKKLPLSLNVEHNKLCHRCQYSHANP